MDEASQFRCATIPCRRCKKVNRKLDNECVDLLECLINEEFPIQSYNDEFGKCKLAVLSNLKYYFSDAPSPERIERWLATGDIPNLENLVLDGRSHLLLDKTSVNVTTNEFLEGLSQYQSKIEAIHKAVEEGDVRRVKSLIDRIQLSTARDRHGMTPLHKALLYGQTNTVRYLLAKYPHCVNCTDHVSSDDSLFF